MSLDLKQEVFQPVLSRVVDRSDSLRNVKRFPNTGIEGWLKVEVVAALGDRVKSLNNKGPDLTLADGTEVELKAATNFQGSWCVAGTLKYGVASLFLADGANRTERISPENANLEIVARHVLSDGENDWLLGMVKPRI